MKVRGKVGKSHESTELEFIRDRYILVAAIDNVIIEGVWNIYFSERHKKLIAFPHVVKVKDVRG